MKRYVVRPIIGGTTPSRLNKAVTIIATDDLATAKWHARNNSCVFGAGIQDRQTGYIDVGFGFNNREPEGSLD